MGSSAHCLNLLAPLDSAGPTLMPRWVLSMFEGMFCPMRNIDQTDIFLLPEALSDKGDHTLIKLWYREDHRLTKWDTAHLFSCLHMTFALFIISIHTIQSWLITSGSSCCVNALNAQEKPFFDKIIGREICSTLLQLLNVVFFFRCRPPVRRGWRKVQYD